MSVTTNLYTQILPYGSAIFGWSLERRLGSLQPVSPHQNPNDILPLTGKDNVKKTSSSHFWPISLLFTCSARFSNFVTQDVFLAYKALSRLIQDESSWIYRLNRRLKKDPRSGNRFLSDFQIVEAGHCSGVSMR